MIPQIIHYCWFGNEPYPELVVKCIDSWKRVMPEYDLMCWDSERFNVRSCEYTAEAFQHKKYAFVSDYVRLYALYNYGGIYLDTDVEVLKTLDSLLSNKAFTGFGNSYSIATWLMASEKYNPLFLTLLSYYENRHFELQNGVLDLTPNPLTITQELVRQGLKINNTLQKLKNITVYPVEYFGAYDSVSGDINVTDNTYALHYYNGDWLSDDYKEHKRVRKKVKNKYGKVASDIYEGVYVLRTRGVMELIKTIKQICGFYKT